LHADDNIIRVESGGKPRIRLNQMIDDRGVLELTALL
jgi:hypothetical protein